MTQTKKKRQDRSHEEKKYNVPSTPPPLEPKPNSGKAEFSGSPPKRTPIISHFQCCESLSIQFDPELFHGSRTICFGSPDLAQMKQHINNSDFIYNSGQGTGQSLV